MKTLPPSPLIEVFQATRTRLRVLVLAALVFALVLPASVHADRTSSTGRHAFSSGSPSSALPMGLRAALARDLGPAAAAGVAAATPATSSATQTQILTPGHKAAGDVFGYRVALSEDGNTALVGADHAQIRANANVGAAYVYTRSGAGWTLQQVLTAVDGSADDLFGVSVALSGDGTTAVVGAAEKTIGGHSRTGAAYVFTRSGGHWTQQPELSRPDAGANDNFGVAVAVSSDGTTILVGASQKMVGSHDKEGVAYAYTHLGRRWVQEFTLHPENSATAGFFGASVALSDDGTTALVGAYYTTVGKTANAGAAYVFTRARDHWGQQAELTATTTATFDLFGIAVALSGDGTIALVGALGTTVGSQISTGAAYVFTRARDHWRQQTELTATDGGAKDTFGYSVALSGGGTAALVGAFGTTVGSHAATGAAYLYTHSGDKWTQQQLLSATDAAASGYFGTSVALSGDGTTALVGAFDRIIGAKATTGAAYLYTQPGASAPTTGAATAATTATGTGTATAASATGTATATASGPTAVTTPPTGTATVAPATGTATVAPATGTHPLPPIAPATGTATVAPATGTATGTAAATATATGTPPTSSSNGTPTTAYFAEGYTGTAAGNGRATFTETLNILNPSTAPAPVTLTYYVQGTNAPLTISRTVAATSVLRENVNTDVGADKVVAAQVTSAQRVYVTRTMTRIAPDGSRLDGSATLPVGAPAATWGFPEGYTGVTFQEYLTILNPSTSPAHVTILLAPQAASAQDAKTLTLTVPAQSRATANIRALNQSGSAKSVGMLITSDQPIVPERVLYYGDGSGSGKFGSTVSSGSATPATRLYLAYGSSGGLATGGTAQATGNQAFITLLNPSIGGATVQVTATFFSAAGQQLGSPQLVSVAPGTRQTIVVNPVLGAAAVTPFSAVLSASGPIEAESAQYYGGSPNVGKHPGVAFPLQAAGSGTAVLSNLETSLLDGTSLQRTVYLYNPGTAPVQVAATYYGGNGATAQTTASVPAHGVTTVDVTQDAGLSLPAGALGAQFTVSGGGGTVIAYAVGTTADGFSATEDVGAPAS